MTLTQIRANLIYQSILKYRVSDDDIDKIYQASTMFNIEHGIQTNQTAFKYWIATRLSGCVETFQIKINSHLQKSHT